MKKAFTLIELLVVIAIIAILAAILFPVFAQAKMAAKKTVAISNQKQIGLSIVMYSGDYDDTYPRNDGCTLNDSLNSKANGLAAGTDPSPWCSGSASTYKFAFRDNHYSWQKWVMPYVKSAPMFDDPVQTKDAAGWDYFGEVLGGYQLNIAITGALNTWNVSPTASNQQRNSWSGGTQTALSTPAETMLIMEGPFNPIVPAVQVSAGTTSTLYPMAIKQYWTGWFYPDSIASGCAAPVGKVSTVTAPYGGMVPVSYADGHVKTVPVGKFLADTPTSSQYGLSTFTCGSYPKASTSTSSNVYAVFTYSAGPSWTGSSYPFWGLN